jgi:hypothetical protein
MALRFFFLILARRTSVDPSRRPISALILPVWASLLIEPLHLLSQFTNF